jgi:hypothetical protein
VFKDLLVDRSTREKTLPVLSKKYITFRKENKGKNDNIAKPIAITKIFTITANANTASGFSPRVPVFPVPFHSLDHESEKREIKEEDRDE